MRSDTNRAPSRAATASPRCQPCYWSGATQPRTTPSAAYVCHGRSCPRSPRRDGRNQRSATAGPAPATLCQHHTTDTRNRQASQTNPGSQDTFSPHRTTHATPRRNLDDHDLKQATCPNLTVPRWRPPFEVIVRCSRAGTLQQCALYFQFRMRTLGQNPATLRSFAPRLEWRASIFLPSTMTPPAPRELVGKRVWH